MCPVMRISMGFPTTWPGPVVPEAYKVYPANKVPMEPPVPLEVLGKKGKQESPALKVTQARKAIGVSPAPKATPDPKGSPVKKGIPAKPAHLALWILISTPITMAIPIGSKRL